MVKSKVLSFVHYKGVNQNDHRFKCLQVIPFAKHDMVRAKVVGNFLLVNKREN